MNRFLRGAIAGVALACLPLVGDAAPPVVDEPERHTISTGTLHFVGQRLDLSPRSITTDALRFTGQRLDLTPRSITTEPLQFTGQRLDLSPRTIHTPQLQYTGATLFRPSETKGGEGLRRLPGRRPKEAPSGAVRKKGPTRAPTEGPTGDTLDDRALPSAPRPDGLRRREPKLH